MREIKFILANKNDEGEWDMSFPLTVADLIDGSHVDTFDEDTVVREWTGLKDKNGKEIYEGDVVTMTYPFGRNCITTTIEWEEGHFVTSIGEQHNKQYLAGGLDMEIIGNIYENPELLSPQHQQ